MEFNLLIRLKLAGHGKRAGQIAASGGRNQSGWLAARKKAVLLCCE